MIRYIPAEVTCVPTEGGARLAFLLGKVVADANLVRGHWIAKSSVLSRADGVDVAPFITDEDGVATVMPTYDSYDELWKKSFFRNPFEVDWSSYNRLDMQMTSYVWGVLDALAQQVVIWGVDERTKRLGVFSFFSSFFDSLKLLYEYDEGDTLQIELRVL